MRVIVWMALLALAGGIGSAEAGSLPGGRAAAPALAAEEARGAVLPANHEMRQHRRERRGLLQLLFGSRSASQPRRTQRRPARITPPPAVPQQQAAPRRSAPRSATLAPRPAPAARTPKQRSVAPKYLPTVVAYETEHAPGTIVIDPKDKFLYLVQADGKARRYGIGVGREGFGWSGTVAVGRKAEWPTWTPPREMIKRQPWLAKYSGGMPGGPSNPLGARALYLYEDERDTLYRIHGSNEPWTIGQAVSSGCFRMRNEDVTELYELVEVGAKVVVL